MGQRSCEEARCVLSNKVRTLLIVVVTLVWAANFVAPIFVKDYTPAPELNVAFMAIIGVLTASYRKGKNDDDDEDDKPRQRRKEVRR